MDLSELRGAIKGTSVDICCDYKEIELTDLKAGTVQIFKAPARSDWSVTVQTISPGK
jgi:hypothetical protein